MMLPLNPKDVRFIVLHCSASDLPDQDVPMITTWHLKRGFDTIGYHWFIKSSGEVQVGRSMDLMGSHAEGINHCSIGVCLAGNFDFFPSQFHSLEGLLLILRATFPTASLHGHREFNKGKTCPNYSYSDLIDFWNGVH